MDKIEVIDKVRRYRLLLQNHFELEEVYLYGSYAKGNYNDNSDIDVAVIVKEADADYFKTNPLLWKLRREIDDRIEPILIESNHDESGFLTEIRKDGIEID